MYRVRKKLRFEAAHVLETSYSIDCQYMHGHSYVIELFLQSDYLNADGMIMDFGELKNIVEPYINNWDHAVILNSNTTNPHPTQKVVYMDCNPTAENMAKYLFDELKMVLMGKLYKIRVHETESGYAEYWEMD